MQFTMKPLIFGLLSSISPTIHKPQSAGQLPFQIDGNTIEGDPNYTAPIFPILPFIKHIGNPILRPNPAVNFESAYLYNPTAIVLNETIFLLYRAQNSSKTSSIGLAWSDDGYTFTRLNRPIIYATEEYEMSGGTEDPRIVRVNGTFHVSYTAYDGNTARLCMASSTNLLDWTKSGVLFPGWTKSAAITNQKVDNLYHMYFGEGEFHHSTSPDFKHWSEPSREPFARPQQVWENGLIEPGPAPIKTRDGKWLLVYNGMATGQREYAERQYSVGQMLLDPSGSFRLNLTDPHQPPLKMGPIARLEQPFLIPESSDEKEGQVNHVVFAEGLVQFKGKWFLYYGQADSTLGVATADVQP